VGKNEKNALENAWKKLETFKPSSVNRDSDELMTLFQIVKEKEIGFVTRVKIRMGGVDLNLKSSNHKNLSFLDISYKIK
jgi:hypothetical protein